MPEIAYLNGRYLPVSEAKISILDYGFLFGYAVFETLRTYNGRFFRLEEHLQRLAISAALLEIPIDLLEIRENALETASRSEMPDIRVRITVTPGEGSPVPDPDSCRRPTCLITAVKFIPRPVEDYTRGYRVSISEIRRESRSLIPGLKTVAYLENIRARQIARAGGADEAIFLNEKGFLAESSTSNIFLVDNGILKTPKLGTGLLPGIARQVVLELAAEVGMESRETDLTPADLKNADEAFLTNSLIEIMPVTVQENQPIGSGHPGSVTQRLISAYKERVSMETRNSRH